MSKAFEMISDSLNEIIDDLEKTGGKNLNREILETEEKQKVDVEKFFSLNTNFLKLTTAPK